MANFAAIAAVLTRAYAAIGALLRSRLRGCALPRSRSVECIFGLPACLGDVARTPRGRVGVRWWGAGWVPKIRGWN